MEDDGQGFELGPAMSLASTSGGIGLLGMRERFLALQGQLDIESLSGHGTRLIARLPGVSTPGASTID